MVDTIKISALPTELTPTSNDSVPMVDNDTSTTKQVTFDEFGKAINYTNSLSTDADNLLAVDGSNKLNLTAGSELISSDDSNTLSVGSDGKLFGSATALTLNENELFVGNATSQPISTTVADVRSLLGLPIDYKNVSVTRDSGTQVTVQGSCRSEQDDIDLEISSATPVALLSPVANTRYNLFFAKVDSASATVALFDTASAPAGYAHYRRLTTIPTDSVASLSEFRYSEKEEQIEIWAGSISSGSITLNDDLSNYNYVLLDLINTEIDNGQVTVRYDYNNRITTIIGIAGMIDSNFCGISLNCTAANTISVVTNQSSRMFLRKITGIV